MWLMPCIGAYSDECTGTALELGYTVLSMCTCRRMWEETIPYHVTGWIH